jgi:VanZ family protein
VLFRRLLIAAAWVLLALTAFWTLGPLKYRPVIGPAQLERFGAYFVLGGLFALAYARPWLIAACLMVLAAALEAGQLFVPGRDAGVPDAVAKMLGAATGVGVAVIATHVNRRWGRHVG